MIVCLGCVFRVDFYAKLLFMCIFPIAAAIFGGLVSLVSLLSLSLLCLSVSLTHLYRSSLSYLCPRVLLCWCGTNLKESEDNLELLLRALNPLSR